MLTHENQSKCRLLAKLVWELLHTDTFESLPDLTEALKCRCARLRIRWTNDDISDAYRLISSNTPLPGGVQRQPVARGTFEPPAPELSRGEAARIVQQLVGACIRAIPATDRAAHEAKVRAQADVFRRIRAKRRPIIERLEEIFAPRTGDSL